MTQEVYIKGKRIALKPKSALGKGGEADVYKLGQHKALKVWKTANHPDLAGLKNEQDAAQLRIETLQTKMPLFPQNLPRGVIVPEELATNREGSKIVGYTMHRVDNATELLYFSHKMFRLSGVSSSSCCQIFLDIERVVGEIHKLDIVIGDFNDLNVLIKDKQAFFIDVDSFQFQNFFCTAYTDRFLDPLLMEPNRFTLHRPYLQTSDWYAFAVMLMRTLLFVDPYGGIYKPASKKKRIPQSGRVRERITVFHPDVIYPKPARPLESLSDELLHYFYEVFVNDVRQPFLTALIENLVFKVCTSCGLEHLRKTCPLCTQHISAPPKKFHKVEATLIFETKGTILQTCHAQGQLRWLTYSDHEFIRENNTSVFTGSIHPDLHFKIMGQETLVYRHGQLVVLNNNVVRNRLLVDSCHRHPAFDTNGENLFWMEGDQLLCESRFGPRFIGTLLQGQTRFWVGPEFGFGFYRAGEIHVNFIFSPHRAGLDDGIILPRIPAKLLNTECYFENKKCWIIFEYEDQGILYNKCLVINEKGHVLATYEAAQNKAPWLSLQRGKCAIGNSLFVSDDAGIIRVDAIQNRIEVAKIFQETSFFVNNESKLLPSNKGIIVVNNQTIQILRMV